MWVVGCEERGIQQGSSHSLQIRECPVNDDADLINVTTSLVFASHCSVIVGVVAKTIPNAMPRFTVQRPKICRLVTVAEAPTLSHL